MTGWRAVPRQSRVKQDLRIKRPLGSGGFGTTFLCAHLLDQKDYALKVVKLPKNINEGKRKKIYREVELLSSLSTSLQSTQHVVRYFGAWVEEGLAKDFGLEGIDGTDSEGGFSSSAGLSSSSAEIGSLVEQDTCTCDKCKTNYIDWEIGLEQWGLLDQVLQPLNLCQNCYLHSIPSDQRAAAEGSLREKKTEAVSEFLFILMEYCEVRAGGKPQPYCLLETFISSLPSSHTSSIAV